MKKNKEKGKMGEKGTSWAKNHSFYLGYLFTL